MGRSGAEMGGGRGRDGKVGKGKGGRRRRIDGG